MNLTLAFTKIKGPGMWEITRKSFRCLARIRNKADGNIKERSGENIQR